MTTIADLTAAFTSGATTPIAAAETFLAADPVDGAIGAFRAVDADDVLLQAKESSQRLADGVPLGPLEGVLVGVKDFVAVNGYKSYAGTRDLAAHGHEDAVLVTRLRQAGAIIAGKTHTTELGLSPTGMNAARGTPRNPHSAQHLTGGSSSGTGAAVASGLVPAGVGSDGGGSIRIPSALCGVFGIKPSWNLVPTDGVMTVGWWSLDHDGPIARCTQDLVTLLSVMADVPLKVGNAPLRYGVDWSWWGAPDPEVDGPCRAVVAELSPRTVAVDGVELAQVTGYVTAISELAAGVWDVWQEAPERFSDDVRAQLAMVPAVTGADYVRAQQARRRLADGFEAAFAGVDVILLPTTAITAPPRPTEAELAGGVLDVDLVEALTAYTFPANLCGLPAASVPIGTTSPRAPAGTTVGGLPIGLQLVGRPGADATVLSACAALERAGLAACPTPRTSYDHPLDTTARST